MSLMQMYMDERIEIDKTMLTLSGIPSEPTKQGHCHRMSQLDEQPSNFIVLLLQGYHPGNRCPHHGHIYSG